MDYEFADRLIELRKGKGMSQEELAQRIGLSRQAVSKWERAESSPDIGNLIALAEIYEVTIDEIVKGAAEDAHVGDSPSEDALTEGELTAVEAAEPTATEVAVPSEDVTDDPIANMPPPDPSQRVDIEGANAPGTASTEQVAPSVVGTPIVDQPIPNPAFAGQPISPDATISNPQYDPAMAPAPKGKLAKDPLLTFPYPVACVVLFLLAGFVFGWWHPAWIIFLTIPFYYWIVNIIVKDPNYQARHGYFGE